MPDLSQGRPIPARARYRMLIASAFCMACAVAALPAFCAVLDVDVSSTTRLERVMTAMRARDRQAASGLAADFKNEPQPAIRAWILRALAAVPVSRGAAVMSAALHDNSALVRLAAAEALARTSGAEAVAQLAAALETESNPGVRHAITDCLGSIKTADSAAALQRALAQDSDANVRAQAARSLRRHGERVGRARKVSGAP